MRLNYAIVFVSDMKRAVAFYRDVIGLPLRFESPGWTELATDGATLALHSAEGSQEESPGQCRPGLRGCAEIQPRGDSQRTGGCEYVVLHPPPVHGTHVLVAGNAEPPR